MKHTWARKVAGIKPYIKLLLLLYFMASMLSKVIFTEIASERVRMWRNCQYTHWSVYLETDHTRVFRGKSWPRFCASHKWFRFGLSSLICSRNFFCKMCKNLWLRFRANKPKVDRLYQITCCRTIIASKQCVFNWMLCFRSIVCSWVINRHKISFFICLYFSFPLLFLLYLS